MRFKIPSIFDNLMTVYIIKPIIIKAENFIFCKKLRGKVVKKKGA